MKWTTELRYKRYDDWSEAEKKSIKLYNGKVPLESEIPRRTI